jgi:hypothetical protein
VLTQPAGAPTTDWKASDTPTALDGGNSANTTSALCVVAFSTWLVRRMATYMRLQQVVLKDVAVCLTFSAASSVPSGVAVAQSTEYTVVGTRPVIAT